MVFEVAVVEDSGVDGVEDLVVGEVEDLEAAAGVGASEEGGEMEEDVDSEARDNVMVVVCCDGLILILCHTSRATALCDGAWPVGLGL